MLRQTKNKFDFTGGSIGNFFFTGARLFFKSMSAAIFLYSRISGIPKEIQVLPAVVTEEQLIIGAWFKSGSRVCGQNNISHPPPTMKNNISLLNSEDKIYTAITKHHSNQSLTTNVHKLYNNLCTSPIERVTIPLKYDKPIFY